MNTAAAVSWTSESVRLAHYVENSDRVVTGMVTDKEILVLVDSSFRPRHKCPVLCSKPQFLDMGNLFSSPFFIFIDSYIKSR